MAVNNREDFNYAEYIRGVAGATEDDFDNGFDFDQGQKDIIYRDAITRTHNELLKQYKGRDQKRKAVDETLSLFDDARSVLGIPEEIKNSYEPYSSESVGNFLNSVHESSRDVAVDDVLDNYVDKHYGEFGDLERPFLKDLDKKAFEKKLRNEYDGIIDFEGSVSQAIESLNKAPPKTTPTVETQDPVDEEDDRGLLSKVATGVGNFAINVGVGFNNAVVDTATGALRLVDNLGQNIAENITGDVVFNHADNSFEYLTPEERTARRDSLTSPLGELADVTQENLRDDTQADGFSQEIAQGAGQLLSLFLGGAAVKSVTKSAEAVSATTTALGISQGGESGYQDYISTIEASGEPFDESTARAATSFNALIGASEAFPVLKALDKLTADGNVPVGTLLKKFDDATGGIIGKSIRKVGSNKIGKVAVSGATGAIEEGGQEIVQTIASNLIASDILQYDPERGFEEGAKESGEVGAVLGAFMNALITAIPGKQRRIVSNNISGQDTVDENAQTETTAPNENVQPDIRPVEGGFVAKEGNLTGVGETAEEAQIDLDNKKPTPLSQNDTLKVATTNLEDGVSETVVTTDNSEVTFTGPDSENQMRGLIRDNDPINEPLSTLPTGLKISQDSEGLYNFDVQGVNVINPDLTEGLREVNAALSDISPQGRGFNVQAEEIPQASLIPYSIKARSFDPIETEAGLTNPSNPGGAFTMLDNPIRSAENFVTPTRFRAYRNGFIYDVKRTSKGSNSNQFNVEITDLDGNKYRPNKNEATQEFNRHGVIQEAVGDAAFGRVSNTPSTPAAQSGLVLRQPTKGFRLSEAEVAGEKVRIIDAESVDEVSKRMGAKIIYQSPSQDRVILERDGESTEIALNDQGQFVVTTDGQDTVFDGGFDFIDTSRPNEATISAMTQELELNGYRVTEVNDKGIVLVNSNNDTAFLPREAEEGQSVTIDGEDFQIETLTDLREAAGIIEPETKDVESTTNTVFKNVPDSLDMVREKQNTMDALFDLTDQKAKVQTIDGKPTFKNDDSVNVVLEVDPKHTEEVLEQIRINASIPTESEIEKQAKNDWSIEQLQNYVDLIPSHIRDITQLHYTENNPAREKGAWGYFTPSDWRNLPAIHVDANKNRDFHSVLSTLSEEVSHFSFNSWNIPELTAVVDRAYDLVKDEAVRGLQGYIERFDIDIDNPTPAHKSLMVNEFFSKQGLSFVEFDDGKIELPPGVSRQQMRDLKKEVAGTLTKVTWDLTKDFKGNREDGQEFIMDILRLQAGSIIGTGVHLDYKVEQNDGTPATIRVVTAPYGSLRQVIPETRNAKRVARERSRLNNATGYYKKLRQFLTANNLVDTAIGRENSIILSGVYNPTSSQIAALLKRTNVQADKVRAKLDSVGIGEIPISQSYYQTFMNSGLNSNKDLKLAKEMDQFMRMAHTKANANVGGIRQELRQSKETLIQMIQNHPSARRNLPNWLRQIELTSRRFTSDWDHIAYEAHQPGGDKDLITMRKILNFGKQSKKELEKIRNARAKIRKLKIDIRDNPNAAKENTNRRIQMAELKRITNVKVRIDALRKWAVDEVQIRGKGNARGIMVDEIQKVLDASQNFHAQQSSGLNDFISALKSRKLDENIEHDTHLMTFLGRITDPLRVSISNLEQQNKILNNINHTTKLAQALVRDGIAQPIGSTNSETLFDEGDRRVLASDNGGLLNFLEVDPEMAVFLREDIEQNKALNRNVVGSGFLGQLITTIKANQTILSPKLAVSNYLSNLSVLFAGGHFRYINEFGQDSISGISSAWRSQTSFGHKNSDGSFGDKIAKEMAELNVFQGSVTSLDAQLTNGQVIQRTLNGITKFMSAGNVLSEGKRISIDDGVNKFMEFATRFYSFGDEYSKVLPYLVNRQIGIAKAQTQIKRDSFEAGKVGKEKYEKAVLDMGTRIAADRTGRETNNWVIAPSLIRSAVRNKTRFILGDYVLHPFQALRIMIENKRLIVEDIQEYRQAKVDGNLEYAKIMKKAAASRAIGNTINDVSGATLAYGGLSAMGWLIAGVYNAFGEDEEDSPLEQKQNLNIAEIDAAYRISNIRNNGWGGDGHYPVSRDGYRVTYFDGKRLSAMNTLVPTRAPTDAVNTSDYVKDFAKNFINLENESLLLKLINRGVRGVDRNGKEMTIEDQWNEVGDLFKPGIWKQSVEVGSAVFDVMQKAGEEGGPDRVQNLINASAQFAGTKMKTVDVRDDVSVLGWVIKNQMDRSRNPRLDHMLDGLTTGDELDPSEVRELVTKMVDNNNEVMGYVNYGVDAFRDFGMSHNLIDKHLRVQTDGRSGPGNIDGKLTKNLLKGVNGFHNKTVDKLERLKVSIKEKEKVSSKGDSQEIQNKINALDKAISIYETYVDKNPR